MPAASISTPYNIAADYGRTSFDTRNRVFLAGSISLPKFIQFSPFMIAQSGSPYNVTVGEDVNGDTFFNDRPYRVTGVAPNGQTVKTINGCGTFAAPGSEPDRLAHCTDQRLHRAGTLYLQLPSDQDLGIR